MAPGRPYQLSDSCLHSTMDPNQIRGDPFNFWGLVGCLNCFAMLTGKHVRTAMYAPGCIKMCQINQTLNRIKLLWSEVSLLSGICVMWTIIKVTNLEGLVRAG